METRRNMTTETNDAIIEAMIEQAQGAPRQGTQVGEVVSKGDDPEAPAPMIVHSLEGDDRIILYNTRTGVPSYFVKDNAPRLRQAMKQRFNDGKKELVWSPTQTVTPRMGTHPCMLHASDPNRAHYDEMGMAVCPAGKLASPYEVQQHMMKKHPKEWGAIEHERIERERLEDRAAQAAMMNTLAGKATTEPTEEPERELYVSKKDREAKK
jgi:hypothetical protein